MDLRAELSRDELALSEQTYDQAGKRVQGSAGRSVLPLQTAGDPPHLR